MKTFALVAALVTGLAGPAAAETTLKVRFEGMSLPQGAVKAALFDEATFKKGGRPVGEVAAPVSGAEAEAVIADLKPGRYGLKVYHDVNGDGRMNTNPFGLPTEPVAFSNDAPMRFGPAKWVDAAFEVKPGENVHVVTIR